MEESGPGPAGARRSLASPERARALHAASIARIMKTMNWTTPAYEELKMDAEIGSYQEDGEEEREWSPIAEPARASDAE